MSRIKQKTRRVIEKVVGKYGYSLVKNNPVGTTTSLSEQYPFIINNTLVELDREALRKRETGKYTVSWVIPPLGPGSGGHLDIIRAIYFLRKFGIHNRIYIMGGNEGISSKDLRKTIKEYYGYDLGSDEIYATYKMMKYTDAVIATSWETAYIVRMFNNCISKFYFVQDFEPYFYPLGAKYKFAENTYKMGFRGITAGDWLAKKLSIEYGMETQAFKFAYDKQLYRPIEKKDDVKRIFFYARPYTDRRAFEMGVLALEELNRRNIQFEVVMAGQKLNGYGFEFPYKDMGIMQVDQLCDVYSQCDLCLVLSMTNLSLLPIEIMASNSIVVSNKGENNEWLLNDSNAVMVDCDPLLIADALERYLNDTEKLRMMRENGKNAIKDISWDAEIKKVKEFIVASIEEDLLKISER